MTSAIELKEKEKIISTFEHSNGDYWKTIGEISATTGLAGSEVVRILFTTNDFVESSYRRKKGEPVFTTRSLFRKKAPFWDKLIGAFKNRID